MLKSEIKPGTQYAMREKRVPGTPFQHVRILEHIRGNKWKAEWIDPNPGLIHYAESGQLVVPWKERKAFLQEESDAERLREYTDGLGLESDSPIVQAVEQVIESVGDKVSCYRGILSGPSDAIERLQQRAGITVTKASPHSYVDRKQIRHLPFDEALEIARAFCAAEPTAVLLEVEATERNWSSKASRPGEEYILPLLNQYRASWAIIRQWTGHDAAVAQREAAIKKLERLVWDAIYALQKAGLDSEAARLRRVIEKL